MKKSNLKTTREQLKARAAEIIEDARGFDADTRREVYVKLSWLTFGENGANPQTPLTDPARCERELREAIRKAEKGEPLIEVGHFKPEALAQARTIYRMLEADSGEELDLPDFITNAVQVALDANAEAEGLQLWLDVDDSGDLETGGYSVGRLAILFERRRSSGVEVEPKRDLAGLISGVLSHSDVPAPVYDKLADAILELHDSTDVYNDPAAVRAVLDYHAGRRATTKGGAR